jgi:hypothetical protein
MLGSVVLQDGNRTSVGAERGGLMEGTVVAGRQIFWVGMHGWPGDVVNTVQRQRSVTYQPCANTCWPVSLCAWSLSL